MVLCQEKCRANFIPWQSQNQTGKDIVSGPLIFYDALGGVDMLVIYSATGAEIEVSAYTDVDYFTEWENYEMDAFVECDLYSGGDPLGSLYYESPPPVQVYATYPDLPVGYNVYYSLSGTHTLDYTYDYYVDGWQEQGQGTAQVETSATLVANYPYIDGINPASGVPGIDGSMTVSGYNLVNPYTCTAPSLTCGLGLEFIYTSGDCTNGYYAIFNYSILSTASPGSQDFCELGASNTVPFTVNYDPTPVINSVTPPLEAGLSNQPITISGSGFGTNPTLSVTDPIINISCMVTSASDTVILASCSPPTADGNTNATVTVTSTGYSGSGFLLNPLGGSPNATRTVPVTPYLPPAVPILFFGQPISGAQNVVIGQQIALTTQQIVLPPNLYISSYLWQVPGTTVANYTASAAGAQVTPLTFNSLTAGPGVTFYWVSTFGSNPTPYTVQYSYCVSNGQCSPTSSANFSVAGPTGSFQPQAFLQTDSTGTVITDPSLPSPNNPVQVSPTANPAALQMFNTPEQPANSPVGVEFIENAVPPPGNPGRFIWVQILNSVTYSQIAAPNSGYQAPTPALNQLDGLYPYPSNADIGASQQPPQILASNYASDAPSRQDLTGVLGEAAESFGATMYVLWDPAIPPQGQQACTPATVNTSGVTYVSTPSNCSSIPVPVGAIDWTWSACAINALAPAGAGGHTNWWFVQCGAGTQNTYATSTYPQWGSCYQSQYGKCR